MDTRFDFCHLLELFAAGCEAVKSETHLAVGGSSPRTKVEQHNQSSSNEFRLDFKSTTSSRLSGGGGVQHN